MDAHADDGSPIHQASPRRTEGGDGPKRSGLTRSHANLVPMGPARGLATFLRNPCWGPGWCRHQHSGPRAIVIDLRDATFIDLSRFKEFPEAKSRAQSNGHRLLMI
jgi:hypothetical protein